MGSQRLAAANQLVVGHTAIGQDHRTPGFYPYTRTQRHACSENHCVEQIAVEPDVLGHRTIVEWARQRRDEIDVPRRSSLDEGATGNLDLDFELRWSTGRIVHGSSVHRAKRAARS